MKIKDISYVSTTDLMFNLCSKLFQESNLGLEKRDRNIQYLKQEQEQPSHVSVLERIRLEEETVEEKIRLLSFHDS